MQCWSVYQKQEERQEEQGQMGEEGRGGRVFYHVTIESMTTYCYNLLSQGLCSLE